MLRLPTEHSVEFQALDKPINNRKFYDVFKIEVGGGLQRFEPNQVKYASKQQAQNPEEPKP